MKVKAASSRAQIEQEEEEKERPLVSGILIIS